MGFGWLDVLDGATREFVSISIIKHYATDSGHGLAGPAQMP